ncbi:metal-binding protein, partial [Streptomyces hygroscopicus]
MVDVTREIERKYEATDGGGLPDLAGVAGVAGATDQGVVTLDATYYDTPGRRRAAGRGEPRARAPPGRRTRLDHDGASAVPRARPGRR